MATSQDVLMRSKCHTTSESDSLMMDRVERLMTIPAVGPITALT